MLARSTLELGEYEQYLGWWLSKYPARLIRVVINLYDDANT